MWRALCGVCVLAFWGCSVEEDASSDWALVDQSDRLEREPPISAGCGDFFLYATNASDRRAMTVSGVGILTAAVASGGEFEWTADLPTSEVTIEMLKGSDLSVEWCTDVLYPYGPVPIVRGVAVPSGGTVTLRAETEATSMSWYTPGYVDVILEGVTWETLGGVPLSSLPSDVEMLGVYAGWFPG